MSLYYNETEFTLVCKSVTIVEGNTPYINMVVCRPNGREELLIVIKDGNVEKLNQPLLEELVREKSHRPLSRARKRPNNPFFANYTFV